MNEKRAIAKQRGKWSEKGIPHKGWDCVDVEDLGQPSEICEMCESQEIRYVHIMAHPNYESDLRCGHMCAGHMSSDYVGANHRETKMKNAAIRRKKFLKRKWRKSKKGNSTIELNDYPVTVFQQFGRWKYAISVGIFRPWAADNNSNSIFSNDLYQTENAAKLAAYDHVMLLERK